MTPGQLNALETKWATRLRVWFTIAYMALALYLEAAWQPWWPSYIWAVIVLVPLYLICLGIFADMIAAAIVNRYRDKRDD